MIEQPIRPLACTRDCEVHVDVVGMRACTRVWPWTSSGGTPDSAVPNHVIDPKPTGLLVKQPEQCISDSQFMIVRHVEIDICCTTCRMIITSVGIPSNARSMQAVAWRSQHGEIERQMLSQEMDYRFLSHRTPLRDESSDGHIDGFHASLANPWVRGPSPHGDALATRRQPGLCCRLVS